MEGNIYLKMKLRWFALSMAFPVTRFKLAKTEVEAVEAAEEIGYPVVLKVVSPDILHKSDVEGVMLNLKNSRDVQNAYRRILENVRAKKKPKL